MTHDKHYLQLLSTSFPNVASAATEIINLEAILNLPKGTEHFLADLHGESAAFQHVLKNASGNIRRKVSELFKGDIRDYERRELCTLIYYPEKKIELIKESEPDIYNAIRRDALLENVTVDKDGKIDFDDKSVTENTRVSYPINHIEKIVKPISAGPAAKNVIFLSADAFGVLPPVSILTPEQTKYYFLSGFTAKLAGTERGITEPTPTFSACFGQAFLELHPTKYAEELVKRMEKSGAKAYLVNTGWNGTGKRISIRDTRGIIDAILDGSILKAETKKIPFFNFEVPTALPGVDPNILDPRDTYKDAAEWEVKARDLAGRFIKNFVKYEGNAAGKALVPAGPQLPAEKKEAPKAPEAPKAEAPKAEPEKKVCWFKRLFGCK